jgi:hypothetical protein
VKNQAIKNLKSRFLAIDGPTGSYSGPEVGFEDISAKPVCDNFWLADQPGVIAAGPNRNSGHGYLDG